MEGGEYYSPMSNPKNIFEKEAGFTTLVEAKESEIYWMRGWDPSLNPQLGI